MHNGNHRNARSTPVRGTNSDKRRRVIAALRDPEMQRKSDRSLARRLGVSQPFVSRVRKAFAGEDTGNADLDDNVITQNAPQVAADHSHTLLSGEALLSAGCSPHLAKRLLDHLAGMKPAARRRLEQMLVEVLL